MEHYYSESPKSELRENRFYYEIEGRTLEFVSVSGVFGFSKYIDKASKLLIENFFPSSKTGSVLDVGCGFGPIAISIKAKFPSLSVTAIDINERAVAYTKQNAQINNLEIEVIKSNLYESLDGRLFNDIVSNPPIAAGKLLNTSLINHARDYLAKNGALWLVAFHNKGGETLKRIMKEAFGNVEDIKKKGGIRVYRSQNLE
jgi:16S rRNA (guanine1207-N2)-methyltransferase